MISAKTHSSALAALLLLAPPVMADDPTEKSQADTALITGTQPFPDPDKLPPVTALPDPLTTFLGQPVKTRDEWMKVRGPELRRLFQHYMYGQMPAKPATLTTKLFREDKAALGGKATLREVEVRTTAPETRTHLLLVIPNKRTGPAPIFLGINFNGNHALLADPQIQLPTSWMPSGRLGVEDDHKASDAGRGKEADAWAIEQTIERGYAVASFYHGDIVPDNAELARKKLAEFPRLVAGGTDDDAPATIGCWAWGFSRMIDYLVTDADIDAKRLAVVGHSRNGKTALLAAVMDERIALAIPSQAGCGGSAPNRLPPELQNPPGGKLIHETVKRINTSFPHWFCGNFKAFNDATDKLPFDQHELIALCAPRAVLLSNATEDLWANPAGQFEMLRAANPVYKLVAGEGLGADKMPEIGTLLSSRLGYFIRPGKHSMTAEDWKTWLDYADQWLKTGRAAGGDCCESVERGSASRSRTALLTRP
jgi:hypothetical protein